MITKGHLNLIEKENTKIQNINLKQLKTLKNLNKK